MNQLPAATHMGPVELSVADLERSLDYYRSAIGLTVLEESGGQATLGAGTTELLRLVEEPGAAPPTATAASSISPCSSPTGRHSAAGSPMPDAMASS